MPGHPLFFCTYLQGAPKHLLQDSPFLLQRQKYPGAWSLSFLFQFPGKIVFVPVLPSPGADCHPQKSKYKARLNLFCEHTGCLCRFLQAPPGWLPPFSFRYPGHTSQIQLQNKGRTAGFLFLRSLFQLILSGPIMELSFL